MVTTYNDIASVDGVTCADSYDTRGLPISRTKRIVYYPVSRSKYPLGK